MKGSISYYRGVFLLEGEYFLLESLTSSNLKFRGFKFSRILSQEASKITCFLGRRFAMDFDTVWDTIIDFRIFSTFFRLFFSYFFRCKI